MNRSARIVSVTVATGALAACSIAGLAAVNTALSARNDPSRSMAVVSTTAATASATAPLPPISTTPLEVPVVEAEPVPTPPGIPSRAGSAASTPSGAPELRARDARAAVLAAAGGIVLSTSRVQHGGFRAWAVEVLRDDGSIVIGYVDSVGGAVYDWTVRRAAATPAATTSSSSAPTSGEHASDDDENSHDSDDD